MGLSLRGDLNSILGSEGYDMVAENWSGYEEGFLSREDDHPYFASEH